MKTISLLGIDSIKNVELVISCWTINPFSMNISTPISNITVHFNDEVSENIRLIPEIGQGQFLTFWTECLILAKVTIKKKTEGE